MRSNALEFAGNGLFLTCFFASEFCRSFIASAELVVGLQLSRVDQTCQSLHETRLLCGLKFKCVACPVSLNF